MQQNNAPYTMDTAQVYAAFSTAENGITDAQAESLGDQHGKNVLVEGHKKTLFSIILGQFKNLMILVLLAAAVISALLSEMSDAIIIFVVILLNTVMGTVQESKAEAALEALKKMAAPDATVIRGGRTVSVKAADLVPGDMVILEAGDYVPADLRLVSTASLKIEQATLTGESVPSDKDAAAVLIGDTALAERVNMAYSGTSVTYGRGQGVVVGIGMNTEIGKIAGALSAAEDSDTPLQKRMNALSKVLSIAVLAVAAVIFAIGLLTGRTAMDMFFVAVSLAVAAIPEGLATVVTLQLTMGVQKMSKRGAIIRKLPAVETLGSTSIICSDKTGTLTQNKMRVLRAFYNNEEYETQDTADSDALLLMDRVFLLCNDTKETMEDGQPKLIGDPTETALYAFAAKRLDPEQTIVDHPRVYEIPFDSERKLMSTVNGSSDTVLYVKGAPDELLAKCSRISMHREITRLDEAAKTAILGANDRFARGALRVLAAAYKPLNAVPTAPEGLEDDLVFIGLAGMMDPPRPEAKEAVSVCKEAGITPVMITGDHKITAQAVAGELGILHDGSKAVTGRELEAMSDEALGRDLNNIGVYARVAPEHKVRIVKAFRAQGNVVAMTGDGVNDAPALKTADIGVGMGITGTEVSKNASDMVLTDDNFATIVKAVGEGRRIYRNIKKAVQFLLSANLSEVLTLFVGTMLGAAVLYPAQILWVNLVTDTFPALALGMEKAPENIMQRKPRDAKQSFFADGMALNMSMFGIIMSALTLGIYFAAAAAYSGAVATTMAFLTLGLTQLFHVFNVRSSVYSVFMRGRHNKWMYYAFALSVVLQIIVVLVPALNEFFKVVALTGAQWLYVCLVSFAIIPISEAIKLFKRLYKKFRRQDIEQRS